MSWYIVEFVAAAADVGATFVVLVVVAAVAAHVLKHLLLLCLVPLPCFHLFFL